MDFPKFLFLCFLVGVTYANPISSEKKDDDKVEITKELYKESFAVYTSSHNIVNILFPLNSFNFEEDPDFNEPESIDNKTVIFFVEADIDAAGHKDYKGLYVLKNGHATKILENGQAAAASSDDSTDVFFGASDGIYKYDSENNKAVKYGPVTDNIIDIVKENKNDIIYYLNANHELYKVSEGGTKKEKVDIVRGALEIVLDYSNNLYFYSEDKKPYVLTSEGLKKIEGLPENPSFVKLVKPPFVIDDSAVFLSDDVFYVIYANGTSELSDFVLDSKARPSAYAMEAGFIQFYGYDKKIYKYNLLSLIFKDTFEQFKKFLEEETSTVTTKTHKQKKLKH